MNQKQIFRQAHSLFRRGFNEDYAEPSIPNPHFTRSGRTYAGQPERIRPEAERAVAMLIEAGIARAISGLVKPVDSNNLMSSRRYQVRYCRAPSIIALNNARQDKRMGLELLRTPKPKLPH